MVNFIIRYLSFHSSPISRKVSSILYCIQPTQDYYLDVLSTEIFSAELFDLFKYHSFAPDPPDARYGAKYDFLDQFDSYARSNIRDIRTMKRR